MKSLPWICAGLGIGAFLYVLINQQSIQYSGTDPDLELAASKTSLWGSKQRVSGTGSSILGKAKEGIGKVTGNDQLAGEGVVDQLAGTVKDMAGEAAHAASDTIKHFND